MKISKYFSLVFFILFFHIEEMFALGPFIGGHYMYPFLFEIHRTYRSAPSTEYVGQGVLVSPGEFINGSKYLATVKTTADVMFKCLLENYEPVVRAYSNGDWVNYTIFTYYHSLGITTIYLREFVNIEDFYRFNDKIRPIFKEVVFSNKYIDFTYPSLEIYADLPRESLTTRMSNHFIKLSMDECIRQKQGNDEYFNDVICEKHFVTDFCICLEDNEVFEVTAKGLPYVLNDRMNGILLRPLISDNKCGLFINTSLANYPIIH